MTLLNIGSDPELFLRKVSDHSLVSALDYLTGTKESPQSSTHGFLQADNVCAEINPIPANSLEGFIENTLLVLKDLDDLIEPLGLFTDISSMEDFTTELLSSNPLNEIAGCMPDYNAWLCCENKPTSYLGTTLRAAGGHISIEFSSAGLEDSNRTDFVKALDMEIGLASVVHDLSGSCRRELYGKAGSFRPKFISEHGYDGLEYRVLSNYWLRSREVMTFIYNKIEKIEANLSYYSKKADSLSNEIVRIINQGTRKEAISFCNDNNIGYSY